MSCDLEEKYLQTLG